MNNPPYTRFDNSSFDVREELCTMPDDKTRRHPQEV